MENPVKMDDLGVPLFSETPIYQSISPIDPCPAFVFTRMDGLEPPKRQRWANLQSLEGRRSRYVQYFLGRFEVTLRYF